VGAGRRLWVLNQAPSPRRSKWRAVVQRRAKSASYVCTEGDQVDVVGRRREPDPQPTSQRASIPRVASAASAASFKRRGIYKLQRLCSEITTLRHAPSSLRHAPSSSGIRRKPTLSIATSMIGRFIQTPTSHPMTMARRVSIARFDHDGEHHDDRRRGIEVVSVSLEPNQRSDPRQQFLRVNRL
jgi:hypothetical protein